MIYIGLKPDSERRRDVEGSPHDASDAARVYFASIKRCSAADMARRCSATKLRREVLAADFAGVAAISMQKRRNLLLIGA